MSDSSLRWGLLATGRIAHKFSAALQDPASAGRLVAAASRQLASAETFAAHYPGCRAHGSYEALLADPEVQAIYVSTPHPLHAEWSIKAAAAGKHVLCEKPAAMNLDEATRMIDTARAHGVFFMEAFMYRCHPQTARLIELIRDGAIGEVREMTASYGFAAPFDPASRLFSKELGGGGILDVGCYTTSMARLIAGAALGRPFAEPATVTAEGRLHRESGVDYDTTAELRFSEDLVAHVRTSVFVPLENLVRIDGTGGSLVVRAPWSIPVGDSVIELHRSGSAPEQIVTHCPNSAFTLEAAMVAEHLAAGEAPAMPHADTLGNMTTLDRWRAAIGLEFVSKIP